MDVVLVLAVVIPVALALLIIRASYVKCKPHEALIVSGMSPETSGQAKIILSGATVVLPLIQVLSRIDLNVRNGKFHLASVYTKEQVPLALDAKFAYKIPADEISVALAAQALLGKTIEETNEIVADLLERQLIAFIQQSKLIDLRCNYHDIETAVLDQSRDSLSKLGLAMVSFSIKSFEEVYPCETKPA